MQALLRKKKVRGQHLLGEGALEHRFSSDNTFKL